MEKYYNIEEDIGQDYIYITDLTKIQIKYLENNIGEVEEEEEEENGIIFKYFILVSTVIEYREDRSPIFDTLLFDNCIKYLEEEGFKNINPPIPPIPAVFLGKKKVRK